MDNISLKKAKPNSFSRDYWNTIVRKAQESNHENLWRAHMKQVYLELIGKWLGDANKGITLKTDLYDEAISEYNLIPLFGQRCERIIGTDASFEVAVAAKRRMVSEWDGWGNAVVSDIRNSSFKADSFDQIISNSTLDHFTNKEYIITSLRDLYRILKPGGVLIITLDNPSNPVVYLRNLLSYRLLKFFGTIPFYMGVTVSRSELIHLLESNGFSIHDSTAIEHCPRILVIWIGHILEKFASERIKVWYLRLLGFFERLERFPMRYLTGYFVAVKAVKKQTE